MLSIDYTPKALRDKLYELTKLLKDAKKYYSCKDFDNGEFLLQCLKIELSSAIIISRSERLHI